MDYEKKVESDDEDAELEALRLAALATLKKSAPFKAEAVTPVNRSIPPVAATVPTYTSTYITYGRKDYVPNSVHNNQFSWKNPLRRGRGRGSFPKITQRSNLIVITPVIERNPDKSNEKPSAPQLELPQHKWCQSVNEDSSSPRTYPKRGPTRFNRHESGSDSSDSDYDNSDHDSYSNETILQDEHSERFTQLTPEESIEDEQALKAQISSERRLSFQSVDSNITLDKRQSSKTTDLETFSCDYTDNKSDISKSLSKKTDCESVWNRDSKSYSQYKHTQTVDNGHSANQADSSSVPLHENQPVSSVTQNGGSCERKESNFNRSPLRKSDVPQDIFSDESSSTKGPIGKGKLSQNDLRLELKKRMQKLQSEKVELFKNEKDSPDRQLRDRSHSSDRVCHRYSRSQNFNKTSNHSKAHEPSDRHARSRSPNRNRQCMRSPVLSRHRNRDRSRSSERSHNRNLDGNYKREQNRTDRNRKLDGSHSPDNKNNHTSTWSSEQTDSKSPVKRFKTASTRSPDNLQKNSQSPERKYKLILAQSPKENHKPDLNRSRDRSRQKQSFTRSPEQNRKRSSSQSPDKNRKRSWSRSPRRKSKKDGWIPDKNRKRSWSRSPEKKSKRAISPNLDRSHKRALARSPEKKQRQSEVSIRRNHHKNRSSRSSSSFSSSSSSTSSSSGSSPCVRSVSSVIKPVQSSIPSTITQDCVSLTGERLSSDSDFPSSGRRNDLDVKLKVVPSIIKSSIVGGEIRSHGSDVVKRLPVHMRLGTLPRNRLIQMTKDVEAVFVNTSSEEDEDLSLKCKKQNFRVVTEMHPNKSGDSLKRHVEKGTSKITEEKSRRWKSHR